MEDILASIRRIIAEDQSNSLGRSNLGGLTRRTPSPPPAAEETVPASILDEPSPGEVFPEAQLQADPQPDSLHPVYEAPTQDAHGVIEEAPVFAAASAPEESFHESEPVYAAHEGEDSGLQHVASSSDRDDGDGALMSAAAGASITSSFHTLAESVMFQDPGLIERILRESMRPLLKAWLDDNLPSIVERLVRTEIERVARGGRGRSTQ